MLTLATATALWLGDGRKRVLKFPVSFPFSPHDNQDNRRETNMADKGTLLCYSALLGTHTLWQPSTP